MEIEARTYLTSQYGIGSNLMIARAQRIETVEEFYQVPCMDYAAVWAEIARTVLAYASGQEDLGIVAGSHADPRIGLGILQKYIITRLELLDQVVFEKQCIRLRLYHRIFGIRNLRDHYRGLAREPLGRHKILRDPLMQVFCLTHINHIPLSVIVSIDARGMRKKLYLIS
jgi:hypothetical protein